MVKLLWITTKVWRKGNVWYRKQEKNDYVIFHIIWNIRIWAHITSSVCKHLFHKATTCSNFRINLFRTRKRLTEKSKSTETSMRHTHTYIRGWNSYRFSKSKIKKDSKAFCWTSCIQVFIKCVRLQLFWNVTLLQMIGWYLKKMRTMRVRKRSSKKKQSKQRTTIVMRRQHHIFNNSYSQLVNKYICIK